MQHRGPLLLILVVSFALSACAASRSSGPAVRAQSASLRVENRHWLDVVVYVVSGGHRSRVGQVTAAGQARFALPSSVIGPAGQLRFIADPVGSPRGHTTETVVVRPGQVVEWTLERDLATSSLSVR